MWAAKLPSNLVNFYLGMLHTLMLVCRQFAGIVWMRKMNWGIVWLWKPIISVFYIPFISQNITQPYEHLSLQCFLALTVLFLLLYQIAIKYFAFFHPHLLLLFSSSPSFSLLLTVCLTITLPTQTEQGFSWIWSETNSFGQTKFLSLVCGKAQGTFYSRSFGDQTNQTRCV